MIVDRIRHECRGDVCELRARVRSEAWSREEFEVWYRLPAEVTPEHRSDAPDSSPFVAAFLPWCLRRAEALRIEGTVSPRLLDRLPEIIDVYRAFWPEIMSPVQVAAEPQAPSRARAIVGSFFTRGVDSWYTVLTYGHRRPAVPPLTHLVYVPSLDFMYDDDHRQSSARRTAEVARALGLTPVVVETNLRRHTETFLHWGYYSGAGLASISLVVGLDRMLIAGAHSYAYALPEGTHALLDPLWSTERTEIVMHGQEATRWDKIRVLADHPEALTSLKVCFEKNTDGNCGRCAKCLTSMLMLACVDALDACPFDVGLDPRALARLSRALVEPALPAIFRKEVLRTVRDPRLALALYAALLRWTAAEAVEQMRTEATSLKTALASRARQRPRSLHSRWPDATRSRPGGPPAGARAPAPR